MVKDEVSGRGVWEEMAAEGLDLSLEGGAEHGHVSKARNGLAILDEGEGLGVEMLVDVVAIVPSGGDIVGDDVGNGGSAIASLGKHRLVPAAVVDNVARRDFEDGALEAIDRVSNKSESRRDVGEDVGGPVGLFVAVPGGVSGAFVRTGPVDVLVERLWARLFQERHSSRARRLQSDGVSCASIRRKPRLEDVYEGDAESPTHHDLEVLGGQNRPFAREELRIARGPNEVGQCLGTVLHAPQGDDVCTWFVLVGAAESPAHNEDGEDPWTHLDLVGKRSKKQPPRAARVARSRSLSAPAVVSPDGLGEGVEAIIPGEAEKAAMEVLGEARAGVDESGVNLDEGGAGSDEGIGILG